MNQTFNAMKMYYVCYCRRKRFDRKCPNKGTPDYNCIVFVGSFANSFRLITFDCFFLEAENYLAFCLTLYRLYNNYLINCENKIV